MPVDGLWAWGAKLWIGARAHLFLMSALLVLAACGSGDGRKRAVECQSDDDCGASTLGVCDTVSCVANRCELDSLPDGHRCNDDDPQTGKDACLSGICAGVVMTCDDDLGPCLKAVHDPVTDECTVEPVDDGAPCDDDDACSQVDACQAGECVGDEVKACTAVDDCHVDGECDPSTGECSDRKAKDGAPCDDALVCTTDDACQDGVCGGQTVTCDDGLACSVDSCDEKSGGCAVDKTACSCATDADCSDGNACNGQEVCGADDKLCRLGTAVTCPSSANPCQANVCVAETGACELQPVKDGAACDDANACTARDTCQSGACVGSNAVACAPLSQCHVAGSCDPVTGACSNPEKANNTGCNDGNACTVTDTCQAGACVGAAAVVCAASDQCHDAGVCNSATGICSKPAKQNGVSCNDANRCTNGDACQNGACTPTGQVACPAVDSCHTAGVCDPTNGCSTPKKPDGATCGDGLVCTGPDVCANGVCGGAKVACDDGVACTADSCVEALGGCTSTPTSTCKCAKNADCNDANPCNGAETCNLQTLQCVPGIAVDCSALNDSCNAGACSPATGKCTASPKADGAACDDSDKCTGASSCQAGVCKGSNPVICGADQCHDIGTCNAATGVCSSPVKANGSTCTDGNACTKTDSCQSGVCTGASPVVCAGSEQCRTCDTSSGLCTPAKPDGTSCDDGSVCTPTDTCQSGACRGVTSVICTASDQCHDVGTCDAKTGCSNPAKPDRTPCDDASACTLVDTCGMGKCSGNKRLNLNGDWADDPGNLATSVDIFTDGNNNAHIAGTYTAALRFNDKDTNTFQQLALPTSYAVGIYRTVYTEAGVVAAKAALNIGGVGTDAQGLPGTLTVVDAAGNKDGSFTLLGTFTGPATFGASSKVNPAISLNISTETVFVARFAADGTISWVAPLLSDAKSTYTVGSLAAYDDGSVIASGTMTAATSFFDKSAKVFAFDDRAGVWAARLGADGIGQWAGIVVTPGQSGAQVVGNVTTHEDGGATLSGRFSGNVLLGPKSEISVTTTGARADVDVWYLKLDKAGAKLWGGRVGGAGGDWGGDVARIPGGGALLVVNTLGTAVNGSDSKTTQQFLATATTGLQTHIIGIDASGVMQTDGLIANPTAGATRGWQLKRDLGGFYAVAGTFQTGTSFYSSVGFGAGAPKNAASFTVGSLGQGPLTLFVARVDQSSKFGWAVQAGGDGSGMAVAPRDLVMTAHPSHSITLAGMFNANAVFGDKASEPLSVAAGATGNPFVVHLNSEEEYDYCP